MILLFCNLAPFFGHVTFVALKINKNIAEAEDARFIKKIENGEKEDEDEDEDDSSSSSFAPGSLPSSVDLNRIQI